MQSHCIFGSVLQRKRTFQSSFTFQLHLQLCYLLVHWWEYAGKPWWWRRWQQCWQLKPCSDGSESFLARRVPDLKFNLLAIDLDSFDHEVHPYGSSLARGEHALGEPPDKTSLTHSGVANQDHLQTNILCDALLWSDESFTNLEQIFVIFHLLWSDWRWSRGENTGLAGWE